VPDPREPDGKLFAQTVSAGFRLVIFVLDELETLIAEFGVDALFLEGISIHKPNLYYVTGFLAVDKTYYTKTAGQPPVLAATDMVCERARRLSPMRAFHSLSPLSEHAVKERLSQVNLLQRTIKHIGEQLLPHNGVVGIASDTDAQAVAFLQQSGISTKPVDELFLRLREVKSPKELRAIEQASRSTEATFQRVVEVIQNAKVGANRTLMHEGAPLTVGRLKRTIEHALIDNDSENSQESIVAVGGKGADFHYLGQRADRLRSETPIIIDIYPRRIEERYHADITRTIVRGKASPKLHAMFEAVEDTLNVVIDSTGAGDVSSHLVEIMADTLQHHGYPSFHRTPGIKEGMLHGLGHGIGLDVHELPRLNLESNVLRPGAVVAVEPGLYYHRIGGVRIEDDAVITDKGARRVTRLPHTYFL
jgi:Xaa-Pro aminopeptidase